MIAPVDPCYDMRKVRCMPLLLAQLPLTMMLLVLMMTAGQAFVGVVADSLPLPLSTPCIDRYPICHDRFPSACVATILRAVCSYRGRLSYHKLATRTDICEIEAFVVIVVQQVFHAVVNFIATTQRRIFSHSNHTWRTDPSIFSYFPSLTRSPHLVSRRSSPLTCLSFSLPSRFGEEISCSGSTPSPPPLPPLLFLVMLVVSREARPPNAPCGPTPPPPPCTSPSGGTAGWRPSAMLLR